MPIPHQMPFPGFNDPAPVQPASRNDSTTSRKDTPPPQAQPAAADTEADRADRKREAEQLTAELRRALLREILAEYQNLNSTFFRRKLKPAGIELSTSTTRL